MVDAGLIVLVSFISRSVRNAARHARLMDDGEFFEVFVDTPLAAAEARRQGSVQEGSSRCSEKLHRNRFAL